MYEELEIIPFLQRANHVPVADVRTPEEFQKAHIPGAINLPLFTNEERKVVGTSYRREGREEALQQGLQFVQPRLLEYINRAKKFSDNKEILLHCWRGGLRSSSLAWLFDLAGFSTGVLKGGYKIYRGYVLQVFEKPLKIIVLGGLTGSGKTDILRSLEAKGQQIIDLEELANHKGSAFGSFGQERQSSNEQFENNLADKILTLDSSLPVWVEDESRKIGSNQLPEDFYKKIRSAGLIFIHSGKDIRINRLIKDYSVYDPSALEESIQRISKRLGGLYTNKAIDSLHDKDFATVVEIVLTYYDKTYTYGLNKRDPEKILHFKPKGSQVEDISSELLEWVQRKGFSEV